MTDIDKKRRGRRRGRPRRRGRSRRIIALVIAVDLLGGGSLAYALTRHGSPTASQRPPAQTTALVSHPQDPLTQTVSADPPSTVTAATTAGSSAPAPRSRRRHQPQRTPDGAQASFQTLAASQPGRIGLAIAPLGQGPVSTYGSLQLGHAWSTMKVPVLTTLLADLETSGRQLDPTSRQDATLALEQSDNAAAEALFSKLESGHGGLDGASQAVSQTLSRAGEQVQINTAANNGGFTTWGQTEWSAAGEVGFYRSLARGCLLSQTDTRYVLGLMGDVESDQRWGAGSVDFGAPAAFKGGWGPDSDLGGDYLVRQTAIIGSGDRGYVLSMLAAPRDGAFGTGTQMLSQIAAWVAKTFNASVPAAPASCS